MAFGPGAVGFSRRSAICSSCKENGELREAACSYKTGGGVIGGRIGSGICAEIEA
jgi:hypothetical protein